MHRASKTFKLAQCRLQRTTFTVGSLGNRPAKSSASNPARSRAQVISLGLMGMRFIQVLSFFHFSLMLFTALDGIAPNIVAFM